MREREGENEKEKEKEKAEEKAASGAREVQGPGRRESRAGVELTPEHDAGAFLYPAAHLHATGSPSAFTKDVSAIWLVPQDPHAFVAVLK